MESNKRNRSVMIAALVVFAVAMCVFGYALVRIYQAGLAADLDPGGAADWAGWALLFGSATLGMTSGIVALVARGSKPGSSSSPTH